MLVGRQYLLIFIHVGRQYFYFLILLKVGVVREDQGVAEPDVLQMYSA